MSIGLTNALFSFMILMNGVSKPYWDSFVIVFIDDIMVYLKNKEEHKAHLHTMLGLLKEKLFYEIMFLKCEFWLPSVSILGHMVSKDGDMEACKRLTLLRISPDRLM